MYLESQEFASEYEGKVECIEPQEALCCYHQVPYEEILTTLRRGSAENRELLLSRNFVCINIVDQFLEEDAQKFITEIQIPIQKT